MIQVQIQKEIQMRLQIEIKIRIQIQIHIAIEIQIQLQPLRVCKSQLPNWLSLPDKSSSQTDTCIALVGGNISIFQPQFLFFTKAMHFSLNHVKLVYA